MKIDTKINNFKDKLMILISFFFPTNNKKIYQQNKLKKRFIFIWEKYIWLHKITKLN